MKNQLPNQRPFIMIGTQCSFTHKSATIIFLFMTLLMLSSFFGGQSFAQGTWTRLSAKAPHKNGGEMIVLSDGTILCKSFSGGSDGYGNLYDRLTPDIHGSYVNGTWTTIAAMNSTRLYYSTQVLKDGRVYVAGGEYGSGNSKGETYDPLSNVWTAAPNPGKTISDANSEIFEDGRVLQACVTGSLKITKIYDPVTNTYSDGPSCLGKHNESSWVKLADNSILMVDRGATTSERFIPSLNKWIADANVPVNLYDGILETGAALLLPDGRVWHIGSTGHTAYYTPSGDTLPGTWVAGPDVPGGNGQDDGPAAIMPDGKILFAAAPTGGFNSPTKFYEFDYLTNTFISLTCPNGQSSNNIPCYVTGLVDLPNGQVLCSFQDTSNYYVYTPSGSPILGGKPTINSVSQISCGSSFTITGTLFNGISEGTCYGDDWQMASNYPIVRLTNGSKVYYARTSNWNSTGVQRGSLPDTTQFTVPVGLPPGTYSLQVIANGIASNGVQISPVISASIKPLGSLDICQTGSVVLKANAGVNYTYQWKKGNQNIAGATNQNYTATAVGNYRVVVTNAYGCSKISKVAKVVTSCKVADEFTVTTPELSLYPNPSTGKFMMNLFLGDESINADATVIITNGLGQNIFEAPMPVVNGNLRQEISLADQNAGVYFVRVNVNDEEFVRQIMISK